MNWRNLFFFFFFAHLIFASLAKLVREDPSELTDLSLDLINERMPAISRAGEENSRTKKQVGR